jgi:hypothetical protein
VKFIAALLILVSSIASILYSINGLMLPEAASVYNKANMTRAYIQGLSLLLGLGGFLILLPQTFRLGGVLLIAHSMITIGCFFLAKDWKGGALEFALLQIPIFMIYVGYPLSVLEWTRMLFS